MSLCLKTNSIGHSTSSDASSQDVSYVCKTRKAITERDLSFFSAVLTIQVFWSITPCRFCKYTHKRLEGAFCIHLQGSPSVKKTADAYQTSVNTKWHGVMSKKTRILIITVFKRSHHWQSQPMWMWQFVARLLLVPCQTAKLEDHSL